MRGKRLFGVVCAVAGMGIGLVAGPVLGVGDAQAAKARTYRYTCLRGSNGGALSLKLLNRESKDAKVLIHDGTGPPVEATIHPHTLHTHNVSTNQGAEFVPIASNRRLLVDGTVNYFAGHGDNPTWQVRCT